MNQYTSPAFPMSNPLRSGFLRLRRLSRTLNVSEDTTQFSGKGRYNFTRIDTVKQFISSKLLVIASVCPALTKLVTHIDVDIIRIVHFITKFDAFTDNGAFQESRLMECFFRTLFMIDYKFNFLSHS